MSDRQLVLNLNLLDFGFDTSWRLSPAPATAPIDPEFLVAHALEAERGGFDAIFLSDGPGVREDPAIKPMRPLEPVALLAALAAETTYVGLIASMSTTFNDPADLARKLMSLDRLSGGRAAWNVVTTFSESVSGNFGLARLPTREDRYRHAGEVVDEVLGHWRADVARGAGSPQGHPVVVQAGGSPQGRALAGRIAEVVFSAELDVDVARSNRDLVRAEASARGRRTDDVVVLPGLTTVLGSTEAEAAERYREFEERALNGSPLSRLAAVLGVEHVELARLDPDAPVPSALLDRPVDPATFQGSLGFREAAVGSIRRNARSLRDAARRFGHLHHTVAGTPEQVADALGTWFRVGAADGFNLMPDVLPDGLTTFVDEVVPLLRARGLLRHAYDEPTLRGRLAATRGVTSLPLDRSST